MSVRVYCPICKGGDKIIWQGTLEEWHKLTSTWFLVNSEPPEWYNYAVRHEETHDHQIMVEYPTQTVPLRIWKPEAEG